MRRKRPRFISNIRQRAGIWYYERQHERLEGGRLVKSLGTRDGSLAQTYAMALNTLCERGDWGTLERWRKDELHITDIARAVREGEFSNLKRVKETLLGDAVDKFLAQTKAVSQKKRTHQNYTSACNLLLHEFGGGAPMSGITSEMAAEWLYEPKATTNGNVWSVRSQKFNRSVYRALWAMVMKSEQERAERNGAVVNITRNPWTAVKLGVERQTRHAFLTPEQWQHLITHEDVAGTPTALLLGLGCLAGLRLQEA